ncbi:MAG: FxsA family protein [Ferrimonas sp.]
MVLPLFVLFAVMPILEIYVLMKIGSAIGAGVTIAIVLLTAAIGASLVRSQGLSTLLSAQQKLNQGELPAQQMLEGLLLAVAGVLLVTPGFVTDAVGLLILLPWTRRPIAQALLQRVQVRGAGAGFSAHFGSQFGQGSFTERDPFAGQGRTFDHEGDSQSSAPSSNQIRHEQSPPEW